jgi:hypothetical protein
MRSHFRSFDSKISFFAFADIITAVSGMLIFITLLLATDLGRPTDTRSAAAGAEFEHRLQESLSEQAQVDAENRRLQELLAAANAAPDLEKLQADIARLRSQLSAELAKQSAVAGEVTDAQAAITARDKTLGLVDLKATIQQTLQEAETIVRQAATAQSEMDKLEHQASRFQAQLLKLRARDGQLWIIPEKSATSKEPILVTVGETGATIERFDHPEQRRPLDKAGADSGLRSFLRGAKALNQYVVFLVRPSGIGLFKDLVKSAREMGFEVGFDALDEGSQVHFSNPPPIDEPVPPIDKPAPASVPKASAPGGGSGSAANPAPITQPPKAEKPQPAAPASPVPPPKSKTWWQKLLEWLGLK